MFYAETTTRVRFDHPSIRAAISQNQYVEPRAGTAPGRVSGPGKRNVRRFSSITSVSECPDRAGWVSFPDRGIRPSDRGAHQRFKALDGKVAAECRGFRLQRFGRFLRVPDGKTRFLTPKCDERGVRREEDEIFSFGHAQQQAVERITVGLRGFQDCQDVFVGYR